MSKCLKWSSFAQMTRNELKAKIQAAETELTTAGAIHRKDLTKHIRRMKKELRDYDRFQEQAKRG